MRDNVSHWFQVASENFFVTSLLLEQKQTILINCKTVPRRRTLM